MMCEENAAPQWQRCACRLRSRRDEDVVSYRGSCIMSSDSHPTRNGYVALLHARCCCKRANALLAGVGMQTAFRLQNRRLEHLLFAESDALAEDAVWGGGGGGGAGGRGGGARAGGGRRPGAE